MMLGDLVVWVGVCFLLGSLAFLLATVTIGLKLLGFLWRALIGPPDPRPTELTLSQRCRQPRCGELNPDRAKFCQRCGRPLAAPTPVDAYV